MQPGADAKLETAAKDKGLGELASWPVSIGYFEAKGGDLTPSYQIDFRLYENGVSRELLIDYGDFSIHGTLTSLEYIKAPECRLGRDVKHLSTARSPFLRAKGPLWAVSHAENIPVPHGLCLISKEIGYRFTVKSLCPGRIEYHDVLEGQTGSERHGASSAVAPSAMAHYREIAHHVPTESPGPRAMTKTVLIVEDNELNMKLFHDLLDAHGYKTLQTRNGMEALALAREHRPDLILMDIQLPEVSGLEVTKWLKEDDQLRQIPVVAVTAFAMKGDEERIREGGCEAYISKPISVTMFLDTVKQFIGEAR